MDRKKKTAVSQYDKMMKTPIPNLILALSVPTIVSMLVTNIYNLVDTAFVGRLGTSASGAVGVVFGFMAIVQAFGFMFGQGSGSISARAQGKKDQGTANMYASTGFFSALFCGMLICAFGFVFLDQLVMWFGSTATIAPYAKTYITYILIAAPFMCSSLTLNNILRYEGRASLGMIGLMTGAVLNMIGDPILMFACGMHIAGAGLSTAVSQMISWIILLSMFLTGRTQTRISWKQCAFRKPQVLFHIVSTGFPSLVRQGLNSLSTMLLNLQCASYGDEAVAAMSIVSRISFFAFSLAIGIGQGFQPVSAFNYGAGNFTRLKKAFVFTIALSEVVLVAASIVLIILPGNLIQLFRDDQQVILIGTRALRLQAAAQLVMPVCAATEMLYQSTGRRIGATFLSSLRSGLIFIPVLLVLSYLRGLNGIQEAQPLALLLTAPLAVPFAVRFFRKLSQGQNQAEG